MTVLENQIERNKKDLRSYYINAQKALEAKNLSHAMELSEQGRIQAELENNYEWIQKFNAINIELQKKPSLNTSIMKEDIALIKGVGPSVAEKLREHGFDTIEKLSTTTISQLSSVRGIGPAKAQKIVEGARALSTRRKLNHFTQPEVYPEETSVQEEVEEYTPQNYDSIVSENIPQKWFSDKFKRPKSGVWYPPKNLKGIQKPETQLRRGKEDILETMNSQEDFIKIDKGEESAQDINFNLLPEKERVSPQLAFVEKETSESTQKETDLTSQGEKLTPSEKQMIETRIGELFLDHKYNIIRPTLLLKDFFNSADFFALKKVEFDNVMDFIIIIPVKVNLLQGELTISQNSIKYIPSHDQHKENNSAFKIILNSYFEHIQDDFHKIYLDLINKGNFYAYIKRHLGLDVSVKKTITHKNLFFTEGNIQLKILIEPVLVCHNNIGFLEKEIPFAYLNDINLHIINENKLSDLLEFLEQKYLLLETHNKENLSLISYNETYEQFLKRSAFLSIPFIGFGVIFLLLILLQSFEALKFLINIGYALLGVFFITISFFYMKVFRPKSEIKAGFLTPYHNKKILLDETSLILINEKLNPELMIQFGYECLGKEHKSEVIMHIEREQVKETIEKNRLLTQVKNGDFFEKKIEKDPQPKSKDLIHRYSSFLED